ncbi:MAG: hypothetical protein ACE5HF_02740 [Gemmatimonadota bacterium]
MTVAITSVGLLGCGAEPSEPPQVERPGRAAWTQLASDGLFLVEPADFSAGNGSQAWIADTLFEAVTRYDESRGDYRMFGRDDAEPVEVVRPRLVEEAADLGVFVYDAQTRSVDLFTHGGEHLKGFELGFTPVLMRLTRFPFGLAFATLARTESDSVPVLRIIWENLEGEAADTLLDGSRGPPSVRGISPRVGETALAPSGRGLWLWSAAARDTVFEIAPKGRGRKLAVRIPDGMSIGLLGDRNGDLLWVLRSDSTGVFHYRAYDVRGEGSLRAKDRFLGARTTPDDFIPMDQSGGIVVGWHRSERNERLIAAWDLGIAEPLTP